METYSSSLCADRKDLESKIEVVQLSLRLSSSSLWPEMSTRLRVIENFCGIPIDFIVYKVALLSGFIMCKNLTKLCAQCNKIFLTKLKRNKESKILIKYSISIFIF